MMSRCGSSVAYTVLALPLYSSPRFSGFSIRSPDRFRSREFAPGESFGLVGDADPVGGAVQCRRKRRARQVRRVVLLRKVRGDDVLQPAVVERRQQRRRRLRCAGGRSGRRSGPSARADSRWPRASPRSWLHSSTSASQRVRLASTYGVDVPRSVSTPSLHAPSLTTNCTGSRASCGTGKGRTSRSPTMNAVMAVEAVHARHIGEALADGRQRAEGEPHRNVVARGECRNAADVVGMLVGDDDCVEGIGRDADAAPGAPRCRARRSRSRS